MRELYRKLKSEFRSYQTLLFVCFVFFMGAGFAFFATRNTDTSAAVSTEGFNPGNIISDAVMANYNSMTVEEIQKFLTDKNPCNNHNYNLYKEQSNLYPKISWHWEGDEESGHFVCLSEEKFGEGVEIGEGQTAAEIIYAAAQEYKINPQVLIVLLEKEQGLISDTYPHSNQYRSATGYGCPDTAACDSKYYGFKNQVFRAAELFRYTLDNGSYLYPDNKKGVYVAYNPSSSCGGTEVFIENRATSALYRYTPYQPNAAALAAGFGMGNICSAYGNRNFYLYFTSWFGSTQAAIDGEQIIIPDGEYSINSATANNRSLGLKSTNAELVTLNLDDETQRWRFERDGSSNSYKITNVATKKVLDLDKNNTAIGTNIQTWDSDDSCGQRWKLYRTKDDQTFIETACASSMVLDVSNNNIQLSLNVSAKSEKWLVVDQPVVKDSEYIIYSALNTSKAIDVTNTNPANGTNIRLWDANGYDAQDWKTVYNSATDDYTFYNVGTGKKFDLAAANTVDGNNIHIWENTGTCGQRWKVEKTSDGYYIIMSSCDSNYAVDITGGLILSGTNIQLWSLNRSNAQKWEFKEKMPANNENSSNSNSVITQPNTGTSSQPTTGVISDGVYTMVSKKDTSKAIDVTNTNPANGTNIRLWDANGYDAQDWRFVYNRSTDDYTIYNVGTGKKFDLAAASTNRGNNIHIWENTGTCGQRWKVEKTSDGYYTLLSACNTNRAVDITNGYTTRGTNIQIWDSNNSDAQKWKLVGK